MRLSVEALQGALAADPGGALSALADVAEADGADRGSWLEKAMQSNGAVAVEDVVLRGSRFQAVDDLVDHATAVYERAMHLALQEIEAVLNEAALNADFEAYDLED